MTEPTLCFRCRTGPLLLFRNHARKGLIVASVPAPNAKHAFLADGGEIGALMRARDWSASPLGPIEDWPQSLKTAVNIMLASPSPISIIWGHERIQLYNDAYIPIAAERHPEALGQPATRNWSEAYDTFLRPIFDRVFAGETVAVEEHAVQLRADDGVWTSGSSQPASCRCSTKAAV